jgi:Rhodopirellula transposase DDE domain
LPWNGTKFVDRETMMEWAKTMPWKGMHPLVELRRKGYQTGVTLSKQAMRVEEDRLERHPALPYWDMLIQPVPTS